MESSRKNLGKILDSLKKYFVDIEIYYKNCQSSQLYFNDQKIVQSSESFEEGTAFRLWDKEGNEYFCHCSHPSNHILKIMERICSEIGVAARIKSRFSYSLPSQDRSAGGLKIFCSETAQLSAKTKRNFVNKLIFALKSIETEETSLNFGQFIISRSHHMLLNSRGFEGMFDRTLASVSLSSDISHSFASSSFLDLSIDRICKEVHGFPSNRRSISFFLNERLKNGTYKVLFAPNAGAELLRHLAPYLTGIHRTAFAGNLTLLDDTTMEKGLNSYPFDGAGFPAEKRVIIENGHFVAPLKSIIRISYTDRPMPGPTNLYIQPRGDIPENMVKEIDRGFHVTHVRPLFSTNMDGSFLGLGSGFTIEHGAGVPICQNFCLSGNVFDVFRDISKIGNDLQFHFWGGCFGSPSILIEKMKVMPYFS